MDRRALLGERRIDAEDRDRGQKPQVAAVEIDLRQDREVPAAQDDENARERAGNADPLGDRQALAEQHERPQRDHERVGRLDQQGVDRLGELQAIIGHGVVGGDAREGEHGHQAEARANLRPVAFQVRPGERQHDQAGAGPADERERDGRDVPRYQAPEHDVAGPEQGHERQEQIGLAVDPGAEAAQWFHVRCRSSRPAGRLASLGPRPRMHRPLPAWQAAAPLPRRRR